MKLRSQRIVTALGTVGGEVGLRDGVIEFVEPGASSSDALDLGDRWLVPGFIDVHVHGGGGAQFNTSDPDEVLAAARFHSRHGTTSLLATTVAAGVDELTTALATIASATEALGGVLLVGAHLEGPFLSRTRPGAMDPASFLEVEDAIVDRLLDAGGGCVRMMTLAPELDGAMGLIERLTADGVVVSLGHSDATFDVARAAVYAGARSATHLFNAMPPFHHRAPGLVGAALDLAPVDCELICDGVHVDPAVMRAVVHAKGVAGVHLVTDAMSAAGMPDGDFFLGGARASVRGGHAVLAEGDSIAGSTLTMAAAVANAVGLLGLPVEDAVVMAAGNPARLLGLETRKGAIAHGMDADLVLLDDELRACGTMIAGEWVHGAP
jgi:N-acetylglucosamine-6-phosphate deacetylase